MSGSVLMAVLTKGFKEEPKVYGRVLFFSFFLFFFWGGGGRGAKGVVPWVSLVKTTKQGTLKQNRARAHHLGFCLDGISWIFG